MKSDYEEAEQATAKFVKKGAGFGNPITNKKVEKAAIDYVKNQYLSIGWKVTSVEATKCGYDLLCIKGALQHHVEVKGVKNNHPSFIITAGEHRQAKINKNFVVCIVTSALSPNPQLHTFTGNKFLKEFEFRSLSFYATLIAS